MSRPYNFKMKSKAKYQLGRNIKAERIRKDVTQEQLAEFVDISLSHASKIEQGLTTPTAFVLYKMAKVLKVPMETFFQGIDI